MKGGNYEDQTLKCMGEVSSISSKKENQRAFCAQRTRDKNIFDWSYPDGYRDKLATIK
jgi:hypothetical protein